MISATRCQASSTQLPPRRSAEIEKAECHDDCDHTWLILASENIPHATEPTMQTALLRFVSRRMTVSRGCRLGERDLCLARIWMTGALLFFLASAACSRDIEALAQRRNMRTAGGSLESIGPFRSDERAFGPEDFAGFVIAQGE